MYVKTRYPVQGKPSPTVSASSLYRWIDLLKVKDVRKASSDAQDKTNLTFEIITDGRVYELLAENGPDLDK